MANNPKLPYGIGYRQSGIGMPLSGQSAMQTQLGGPTAPMPGKTQMGGGQPVQVNKSPQIQQLAATLAASGAQGAADRLAASAPGAFMQPDKGKGMIAGTVDRALQGLYSKRAEEKAIEAKEQEAAAQQAKLQQQADAVYAYMKAQGMSDDQAKAAAGMVQAGQNVDLSKLLPDPEEEPDIKDYNSLQTQIMKDLGKPFMERTQAIRDIMTYAEQGTGFSDHALIFRYMKFLDPNSTVREGEFATVEQTGSIPEIVRVQYNKALEGDKLSDTQRKDLVNAVVSAYPQYVEEYEQAMAPYRARAEHFNMDWDLVSVPEPYAGSTTVVAETDEKPPQEMIDALPDGMKIVRKGDDWIAVPE